jgi:AcrR family transcriptional regulator
MAKVTVDDVAAEAGVSRATIYRLYPGGKDILYDALRARETEQFMVELTAHLNGAVTFEDVVLTAVVEATRSLRADEHLQLMLASAEGGIVATELTVDRLPQIISVSSTFLTPWFAPHIGDARSVVLAELLTRLVLSYFLVPSNHVDLGDEEDAQRFLATFVLPAFTPTGR